MVLSYFKYMHATPLGEGTHPSMPSMPRSVAAAIEHDAAWGEVNLSGDGNIQFFRFSFPVSLRCKIDTSLGSGSGLRSQTSASMP
jgi:hypothetical protein